MVYKEYAQVEGIYFEETFGLIDKIEAIIIFLILAIYKHFKVYQMDVDSTFLNCKLEEEVYIEQLDGFQLREYPNLVCRLKKALYGLKKALRAWYARLENYLL